MNMKKMKLLQVLEDLLAGPGCFSVLFPSFSFLENHRLKVLQLGWGGEWGSGVRERRIQEKEAETRKDRGNKGKRDRWKG